MSQYNPLSELMALAAEIPPMPRQVHAAVYPIFLNGIRQVKGEAGAIGLLFDFAPPISRIVCRTVPISHLRTAYTNEQVDAWVIQIAILEERAKSQALRRDAQGHLQSSSPETLVFNGPWQANHNSPEELIERQMKIRTAFHKTLLKQKNRGGLSQNQNFSDPLAAILKKRFGIVQLIESDPTWQVWQGPQKLIGVFDPDHCNSAEILQAAIRLEEISGTDKKSLLVVCDNADAMMHNRQLMERLTKFDTTLLAVDSRQQLLEQLANKT